MVSFRRMRHSFADIYLPERSKDGTHALRVITKTLGSAETPAGQRMQEWSLFFVAEVTMEDQKAKDVLDIIEEVFEHAFSETAPEQADPATRFESGVTNANSALSALAAEGHVGWVGTLHACVGLVADTQLLLAKTGDIKGLLVRDGQTSDILDANTQPASPLKTFGHIISGTLSVSDRVMIATPQLFEFLSAEKVRRTIVKGDLTTVRNTTEALLTPDSTTPATAAALFIEHDQLGTELETDSILDTTTHSTQSTSSSTSSTSSNIRSKPSTSTQKNATPRTTPSLSPHRQRASSVLHKGVLALKRVGRAIKRLPKGSQAILGGLVIVIAALIGSIVATSSNSDSHPEVIALRDELALVEQDLNRAADFLLFQDEVQARSALTAGVDRLNTTILSNNKSDALKEELAATQERIAELQNRIDKVVDVGDIPPALTIKDQTPLGLLTVENDIVFYDDTSVYGVTPANTIALQATLPSSTTETIVHAFDDGEGGNAILVGSNGSLFEYDAEDKTIIERAGSIEETNYIHGTLYNGSIYTLVPEENQIFRQRRLGARFGAGGAWLDDGIDISNATDLAIDGKVYVVRSNGTIERYAQGARESDWSAETVSQPFENVSFIRTGFSHPYVVIADPATGRMAVYEKETGVLVSQHTSELFERMTDLVITPDGTEALVLIEKKVYRVRL